MVSLTAIEASNALIASTLPPHLVGVFVGATAGIGETTLKSFARHALKPRAYFIGRSAESGARVAAECRTINPDGEFIFIQADVSLMSVVDKVCEDIMKKEKFVNILFQCAGEIILDRRLTSEKLYLFTALIFYSRVRFMINLLPIIRTAPSLRRIVNVGGGTYEGIIYPDDFQALKLPIHRMRGHLSAVSTLALEALARNEPKVSFVTDFPGTVKSQLFERMGGVLGLVMPFILWVFGRWLCVPVAECGERHAWECTSPLFVSKEEGLQTEGKEVAMGTEGPGSGVYSINWDGESAGEKVVKLLDAYKKQGMVERVWKHVQGEFERIAGSSEGV